LLALPKLQKNVTAVPDGVCRRCCLQRRSRLNVFSDRHLPLVEQIAYRSTRRRRQRVTGKDRSVTPSDHVGSIKSKPSLSGWCLDSWELDTSAITLDWDAEFL